MTKNNIQNSTGGQPFGAAPWLGVSVTYLKERLRQHGISITELMQKWTAATPSEKEQFCRSFGSIYLLSYLHSIYQAAPQEIEKTLAILGDSPASASGLRGSKDSGSLAGQVNICDVPLQNNQ